MNLHLRQVISKDLFSRFEWFFLLKKSMKFLKTAITALNQHKRCCYLRKGFWVCWKNYFWFWL